MSRVLLADDSPHAQRMGERILRDEGFEVVSLTDGNAALARLADVDPDVILADVFLPGKSGIELCRFVKSEPRFKHVRVVLTAGLLEPFDEEEAKRAGCDAILKKPFEASRVVGTIDPLVKEAQLARVRPSGQVAPALRVAAPPTGAPPVTAALISAQPAPPHPPISQPSQVVMQPPRAAAAPARSGSLTLLNIGEPMPMAPEPAPKPAIAPRLAEPPKAAETGTPRLSELRSEIAAPPKIDESPAIAVATPSAATAATPSAAAIATPSAAVLSPSAAVPTPSVAVLPTPSAAAVTTPGAAVLPTLSATAVPNPGAAAPSTASLPSPPATPLDAERVRAAVTLALDAALPAMIQEITERVLIALGD